MSARPAGYRRLVRWIALRARAPYRWRCVAPSQRGGPLASVRAGGLRRALGVTEQFFLSFAGLLRQLRGEAKLTQEELAEAAGLSLRAVSDLERGVNRTARKDTAMLLATALGMADLASAVFVEVARGLTPAADVLTAMRAS